jgi:hypothetical protein
VTACPRSCQQAPSAAWTPYDPAQPRSRDRGYAARVGWNLEVACVRTAGLDSAVPDVFGPTNTTMGFEDATSSARPPDLCAAKIGDWVVVIDVACRMSENAIYLTEASASTDLHLVRIADEPIAIHYHDGQQVTAARGLAACLDIAPNDDDDGELCAQDLLTEHTGLTISDDLWDAEFTVFKLD